HRRRRRHFQPPTVPLPRAAWRGSCPHAARRTRPSWLYEWREARSRCGLGERRAFQNGLQAEHRPLLVDAAECSRQVALAAGDGGRLLSRELTLGKEQEPAHINTLRPGGSMAV